MYPLIYNLCNTSIRTYIRFILKGDSFSVEISNQKITMFFMFDGKAEEAMNFYTSLFDQSEIISITRYGANEDGEEGKVKHATFSLCGQEFMCIDSSVKHEFTFTPAISLYVKCDTEDEIDRLFEKLTQDGAVLMPLQAYPFSKKFCWVVDKFGVSWQLSLAKS
jgi:predicted 3-demethylubiquinone-9 3-methyltransferase (glyoxalase superfamily)